MYLWNCGSPQKWLGPKIRKLPYFRKVRKSKKKLSPRICDLRNLSADSPPLLNNKMYFRFLFFAQIFGHKNKRKNTRFFCCRLILAPPSLPCRQNRHTIPLHTERRKTTSERRVTLLLCQVTCGGEVVAKIKDDSQKSVGHLQYNYSTIHPDALYSLPRSRSSSRSCICASTACLGLCEPTRRPPSALYLSQTTISMSKILSGKELPTPPRETFVNSEVGVYLR